MTQIYDYYYASQADQYNFYRIPKALFIEDSFKSISCEAKVLYGLMLDRMCLSAKNKWIDANGRVYIIFTVENIMELMNCSRGKAIKMLDELDIQKGIGLIERVRLGQGKANIIYVKNFISQYETEKTESGEPAIKTTKIQRQKSKNYTSKDSDKESLEVQKEELQKSKKCTSRSIEKRFPEVQKLDTNNTDINNTKDSNILSYQSKDREEEIDEVAERRAYTDFVKENINYSILCDTYNKQEVDGIVEIMTEAICSKKKYLRINKEKIPQEVVKGKLCKIRYEHILYVFLCMERNTTPITNIRQYLLTAIYNAPATMKHFYQAEVRHELFGS